MGEKVNPKIAAYATCDSMSAKGDGAVSSCKKGMDVCLGGDAGKYAIETDAGPLEISGDQQACIAKVKKITSFGYEIKGGVFTPPKVEVVKSKADSHAIPSASGDAAAAKPQASEEPAGTKATAPAANPYAACSNAGAPGSKEYNTCASVIDICQASEEGPYEIFTDAGPVAPPNRKACMNVAPALAKMGYEIVDPSHAPEEEATAEETPAEEAVDEAEDGGTDDEGAAVHVKSFADTNLRLKVTGEEYATEKLTLHFEGGKGIPIKLEYRVEQLESGSYSMHYSVYKGKNQIGDEQAITFEADDGKIDLGFKVKLYDPDDFGSIESITIVEL